MERNSGVAQRERYRQAGFTLIELMVSMLIIAILATMGAIYLGDLKNRAGDTQAFNEGRHLVTALNDAFLAGEDVDFGDGSEITGDIGTSTTGGGARSPIYTMSPDMRAEVDGLNTAAPGDGYVTVFIWSQRGSGKKYQYLLSELTGEVSMPTFK